MEPTVPTELLANADFVRRLARHLAESEHEARDLEQEAWLAALTRPSVVAPRSWFRAVLRNLLGKRRRAEASRDRRQRAAARPDRFPAADDLAARDRTLRAVADAVASLDPPFREVVLLRFYEGLPPRKIAARLGIPVATVRSRTRRAIGKLRARLDREHGGDRDRWLLPLALLTGSRRAAPLAATATGVVLGMKAKTAIAALLILVAGLGVSTVLRAPAGGRGPAPGTSTPPDVGPVAPPSREAEAPEPAPPAGDATAPLRIEVVDAASGSPVPGASVRLVLRGAGATLGEAIADDTGVARLPLARTRAEVLVRAVGYRRGRALVDRESREARIPVEPGLPVRGRVVLAGTDRGVAGARVHVEDEESLDVIDEVITGADGRFLISGVRPGFPFGLRISAAGYGNVWRSARRSASGEEIVVGIGRGATIEGRVLDTSGRPAAGTEVYLVLVGQDPLQVYRHQWSAEERGITGAARAAAGANGGFEFRGVLAPSTHRLFARDGAGATCWSEPFALEEGAGVESRDLRLVTGPSLAISVRTEDDGPVAGAEVRFRRGSPQYGRAWRETTDESGSCVLHPRQAGPKEVEVRASGFVPATVAFDARDGERVRVEVRLVRGLEIPGRLVDSDGDPVGEAHVAWRGEDRQRGSATTAADGTFSIGGQPPGAGTLTARDRHGIDEAVLADVAPGGDPVRLVLERGPRITGRFVPAPGTPSMRMSARAQSGGGVAGDVPVADDGSFVFSPRRFVPGSTGAGGKLVLTLRPEGWPAVVRGDLTVRPDESMDLGEVPLDEGFEFTGTVRAEGAPVAGARVEIRLRGTLDPRIDYTDGEGRFRFPRMGAGPVVVTARTRGFHVPRTIEIADAARAGRPTIDLETAGILRLRVLDGEGRPRPGVIVTGRRPEAPEPSWWSPETGSGGVTLAAVTPGIWTLDAAEEARRVEVRRVEAVAGEYTDVEVRLP